MAPCLCAPTIHKGSFRCRHHRIAARSVVKDADSSKDSKASLARVPCLCAPTSHPGSFRCHLHRGSDGSWGGRPFRPSAHAKALRNAEIPVKAADHSVGLKKAAFARTNRASTPSKLRSELSKAMLETVVAAVEDLRISPKKTIPKRNKLLPAPVPRAGMAKASNNVTSEKNCPERGCFSQRISRGCATRVKTEIGSNSICLNIYIDDPLLMLPATEVINTMRPHNKAAKTPASFRERRIRAKSDYVFSLTPPDLSTWRF